MIRSSCHCAAVRLEIEGELPPTLTSCNCSICRRYGSLWAYYHPSVVKVIAEPGATHSYSWGDKRLAFVRCATCGCMTHWQSLDPKRQDRMGVNANMFEDVDLGSIRIRHLDGADTWKYLD